jgi:hypothetical protein
MADPGSSVALSDARAGRRLPAALGCSIAFALGTLVWFGRNAWPNVKLDYLPFAVAMLLAVPLLVAVTEVPFWAIALSFTAGPIFLAPIVVAKGDGDGLFVGSHVGALLVLAALCLGLAYGAGRYRRKRAARLFISEGVGVIVSCVIVVATVAALIAKWPAPYREVERLASRIHLAEFKQTTSDRVGNGLYTSGDQPGMLTSYTTSLSPARACRALQAAVESLRFTIAEKPTGETCLFVGHQKGGPLSGFKLTAGFQSKPSPSYYVLIRLQDDPKV